VGEALLRCNGVAVADPPSAHAAAAQETPEPQVGDEGDSGKGSSSDSSSDSDDSDSDDSKSDDSNSSDDEAVEEAG